MIIWGFINSHVNRAAAQLPLGDHGAVQHVHRLAGRHWTPSRLRTRELGCAQPGAWRVHVMALHAMGFGV